MKRYLNLSIIVLAAAVLFSSCKKSGTNPDTAKAVMAFNLNGAAIKYNFCTYVTSTQYKQVIISADDSSLVRFQILIQADPTTIKTGQTYSTNGASFESGLIYTLSPDNEYSTIVNGLPGSVTITAVTATTIAGTFSGELYPNTDVAGLHPTYTITNGSFNAKKSQ